MLSAAQSPWRSDDIQNSLLIVSANSGGPSGEPGPRWALDEHQLAGGAVVFACG